MDVKEYLRKKGILFKEFEHPAVYTCEEAEKFHDGIRGIHAKSIFLKDRKSRRFYLALVPADQKIEMRRLGKILSDKIKFANEENLKEILGLKPGSVSPFGLINDKEHKTKVVIYKRIWEADFVSFHPNVNTATLELAGKDFQKYIESLANELQIIKE